MKKIIFLLYVTTITMLITSTMALAIITMTDREVSPTSEYTTSFNTQHEWERACGDVGDTSVCSGRNILSCDRWSESRHSSSATTKICPRECPCQVVTASWGGTRGACVCPATHPGMREPVSLDDDDDDDVEGTIVSPGGTIMPPGNPGTTTPREGSTIPGEFRIISSQVTIAPRVFDGGSVDYGNGVLWYDNRNVFSCNGDFYYTEGRYAGYVAQPTIEGTKWITPSGKTALQSKITGKVVWS